MELIDSHTHLDAEEFEPDRGDVIQRALDAGIIRIVSIGAGRGLESARAAISLAERYDFIFASAGVHPNDAKLEFHPEKLEGLAKHPKVVAIGETGLDFYRDWCPAEVQENWFRAQIELAIQLRKPLIIHSRSAAEECMRILRETGAERVGGVFHCYGEDAAFAARLAEINFLVSIPGSITFKKAENVRRAASAIPLEQIMLETDAPYLAPEPYRGKRCESSFIVETAKAVAAAKGVEVEEVARVTTETARRFFGI